MRKEIIKLPLKLRGKGVGIVEPGQATQPPQEQPKDHPKEQKEQGPKK